MRSLFHIAWRLLAAPFRFLFKALRHILLWFGRAFTNLKAFFMEDIEDVPLGDVLSKTVQNPSGLLDHLDALRKHILRSLAALALATVIAFAFVEKILEFLSLPLEGGLDALVAIDVTEPIGTVMRVALLSGFALAFPYITLEMWLFIAPGVHTRSRLYGLFAIPAATLFFVGGLAFAYYVMLPAALPFLLSFMGIQTIPRPSSYISFVTSLMFWIGISFEFPLVIFILANLGLIKAKVLAQQWRLAVVIIAVVAALITPTVDPVNMSLVMGPMIVLYFLSVFLAWIAGRRRKARELSSLAS